MFVEQWRDRHGKVRVYFRKGKGRRLALPADIGSPEFGAAYAAALTGAYARPASGVAPGTITALIDSYQRSSSYLELRASSRGGYDSRLGILRRDHGHRTVSGMTREGVVQHVLDPLAKMPGSRLDTLKKLRILIRHAIERGWLRHDPTLGIKRPKNKPIRSWTEGEIAVYETHWPVGTKERLAFALFIFIGQRISDVCRMGWPDVRGRTIDVVQQKTSAKLTIPLHSDLAAILAETRREHVTILNTAFGRPFTVKGFGNWMRNAITAACLPMECQPHGLRKAAGRRLAEAGCTTKEIMAVLGHKTLAEAERYTVDAEQSRLADAAVTKLEGQTPNGRPYPHPQTSLLTVKK